MEDGGAFLQRTGYHLTVDIFRRSDAVFLQKPGTDTAPHRHGIQNCTVHVKDRPSDGKSAEGVRKGNPDIRSAEGF